MTKVSEEYEGRIFRSRTNQRIITITPLHSFVFCFCFSFSPVFSKVPYFFFVLSFSLSFCETISCHFRLFFLFFFLPCFLSFLPSFLFSPPPPFFFPLFINFPAFLSLFRFLMSSFLLFPSFFSLCIFHSYVKALNCAVKTLWSVLNDSCAE